MRIFAKGEISKKHFPKSDITWSALERQFYEGERRDIFSVLFPCALITMGESFLTNFTFMHNVKEYEVYSPTSHEITHNVF